MNSLKKVWQVATVYVGTIVGAGFATGKEIVEFFSRFGFLGLLGMLLAGYLFIFFGYKMMLTALRIKANDYFEYNRWLVGKKFSGIVNIFFFCMLFGVTAVMLAGAGEVFNQQFQIAKSTGMILTVLLSIFVMIWGLKGLSAVNMVVVPTMIGFNLVLTWLALRHGFSLEKLFVIPYQEDLWKVPVLPFAYVAFNLSLSQSVFVPLAKEIGQPQILKKGAFLGGVLITVILLLSHISLTIFHEFQFHSIPTAAVMKAVAPFLHGIYLLVIFGEIFTSIIGNAYGIERQLHKSTRLPSLLIYAVLFTGCLAVARFDYAELLSILYPLFGYLSIVFLALLLRKKAG